MFNRVIVTSQSSQRFGNKADRPLLSRRVGTQQLCFSVTLLTTVTFYVLNELRRKLFFDKYKKL